ncbi:MAG: alpha-mannosidase, partial [Chloroflexia bacterium]
MQQEIKRLRRRLVELSAWADRAVLPLQGHFLAAEGREGIPIRPGDAWPSRAFPVRMRFSASIPAEWAGQPVWARLDVGGEGLLLMGSQAQGGLDPYHKEHELLPVAHGGEEIQFEVEAVPRGPFGTPIPEPRLEEASLVVPDLDVRRFLMELEMTIAAAEILEPEIGALLLDEVQRALEAMPLPRSPAEAYLSRMVQSPAGRRRAAELWEEWAFETGPLPLPEETRAALLQAASRFRQNLEKIRRRYPPPGKLALTGHAHLDLAWLWPVAETRRKVRRTFATVCALMRGYPPLVFGQSQAQFYGWLEEDDPILFDEIGRFVHQGQWEILGGMWVEPDGNLLSGESWVRQLLYGQRYFLNRFGRCARVAWLPDSFGFAANLPQLFTQAGLDFFFTTKLTWNETNPFPYDLFFWEGLDGTRILAHSLRNIPRGYNGRVQPADLRNTWENYQGKRFHPVSLFLFGEGDGGGGPTREMLVRYPFLHRFPGLPQLEMQRVEQYFESVRARDLPVWVGEQYLELHRGTYTTQARIKALHRRLEHLLPEAEIAATLAWLQGEAYPANKIEALWKTLLRNQFHDILAGSAIHTVVKETEAELQAAAEEAETIRQLSLTHLSQEAKGLPECEARVVVWNLSLDDRPLQIEFPQTAQLPFRLLTPQGEEIPYQEYEGNIVAASEYTIPGLGYVTLSICPGEPCAGSALRVRSRTLRNAWLHVQIGTDGTLRGLVDELRERQVLDARANQIWAYTDIPRDWDAWDIDASYEREGEEVPAESPPEVVEAGPARCGIRVVR